MPGQVHQARCAALMPVLPPSWKLTGTNSSRPRNREPSPIHGQRSCNPRGNGQRAVCLHACVSVRARAHVSWRWPSGSQLPSQKPVEFLTSGCERSQTWRAPCASLPAFGQLCRQNPHLNQTLLEAGGAGFQGPSASGWRCFQKAVCWAHPWADSGSEGSPAPHRLLVSSIKRRVRPGEKTGVTENQVSFPQT